MCMKRGAEKVKCYWPNDQGTHVKRIDTVILKKGNKRVARKFLKMAVLKLSEPGRAIKA